jgi:8-oxo-dGTP pyrophosphatase MutT (NUDIX family)
MYNQAMQINEIMLYLGKKYPLTYKDSDDFSNLPLKDCAQVYGVCFCGGKIVLGFSRTMQKWSLIGGTIEPGEELLQALAREIKEESNMELIKCWPIGHQISVGKYDKYQLRYACMVQPYGPFVADPDAGEGHGVDRITLIDPKDFTKHIKWGKIGNRLLERALELTKN